MLRKDNKKIYLFISVLIICISLLLPLFHSIYSSVVQTITTEYYNIEAVGEIIQGTEITEDIYIPSGVKKYRIMFATYIRNNVGHVKVEIHQGDRILEELVDVSSLADNAMHEFNMDMSQLKEGQAKLVIRGVDGSSGNAITVYKSQDTSLGKISVNGIEDNAGIIQSFTYHSYDYIVKMKIAFSIIVILCIVGVLYIINFREETAKNSIALFSLTFVTIFSMLNVKAPILTFAAETYAELGTNFYINGLKKGFFENIFITDAGYLPLLQRSISLFIIKVLNLSHYNAVVIMQNVAIAFVSAVSALFCLNKFSEYGSRIFRFTICITVGTCALVVTYYDSHSFINFSYYGLVWIILMSMMDLNSVSKWKAICIIVISGLICISKSYFVILIPIVIFIYLFKRKRLSLRDKGYLLSILIGNVIQLLYTVRNINQWVKPTGSYSFDLMDILQRTTYNVVQQIIYIVYPKITNLNNVAHLNIIFTLIVIIGVGICVYKVVTFPNKRHLLLLSLVLLIFGTTMFNVVTTVWGGDYNWLKTHGEILTRHALFIQIGLVFIIVNIIYVIKQNVQSKLQEDAAMNVLLEKGYAKKLFCLIYIAAALLFSIRYTIFDNNTIESNRMSASDWKAYSNFLDEDSYVIPINPYPWMMIENCDLYIVGPTNLVPWLATNQVVDAGIPQIHELVLNDELDISYLFTTRLRENNHNKLMMIGYDKNDHQVTQVLQVNEVNRKYIGFKLDAGSKIKKIRFFDENMNEAFVKPEVFLGINTK